MSKNYIVLTVAVLFLLTASAPALAAECVDCHGDRVAGSSHAVLACLDCHTDAANHGGNMSEKTYVPFDLETCGGCHPDQYETYIYGDDWKTKYGGSPGPDVEHAPGTVNHLPNGDPELWNKLNDFANYNDIIDGYGFTREYNEERSHNVMIQDHHDIARGKKDTCLQCKSTKLAYYWDSGQVKEIENTVDVSAGHMGGQVITIPKGTTVSMRTEREIPHEDVGMVTHETQVVVTLPNGTTYRSFDYQGEPRHTGNWLWAALYALTVNELPEGSPTIASGNGCNHCHDPHKVGQDADGNTTGFRLIRKSLIHAIENHGINPYDPDSPTTFDGSTALTMDEGIALCAQCHVEYVCGNSPLDKIDRDFFSWAKAADLEAVYNEYFPGYVGQISGKDYSDRKYVQDWVHGTGGLSSPNSVDGNPPAPPPGNGVTYVDPNPIREELIKSQHPEAETYWGSRHYDNGAPCFLCHMPEVTKTSDGSTFTSHWLASPNKYMDPEPAAAFAAAFGVELTREGIISPCGTCHGGKLSRMKTKAESKQDDIYADALTVQAALVESLRAIKAAKDAQDAGDPVNLTLLEAAAEDHRAAHVRWENLVVSENSMGFHNPTEVGGELANALSLAQSARQNAEDALGAPPCDPEICDDGIDNDCDGFIDGDDPDCQVADCTGLDEATCTANPDCRWNKNRGCLNR